MFFFSSFLFTLQRYTYCCCRGDDDRRECHSWVTRVQMQAFLFSPSLFSFTVRCLLIFSTGCSTSSPSFTHKVDRMIFIHLCFCVSLFFLNGTHFYKKQLCMRGRRSCCTLYEQSDTRIHTHTRDTERGECCTSSGDIKIHPLLECTAISLYSFLLLSV